jgi:iron complex transport system ATP-binding protein
LTNIVVEGLVVGYGSKSLIHNLSFSLPHSSFLAVLGHNGSGKTTFFKALSRMLPYEGSIVVAGKNLRDSKNPAAEGLLAVLEQRNAVTFPLTVKELVVMGLYRHKHFYQDYNAADFNKVAEVLATLEIAYLSDRDFTQLSGGEQQMVWLAQLMIQDAAVLLLDEPTQQLDIYNKKKVFELMRLWVEQQRKTVICITHDIHNLMDMSGYLLNISATKPILEKINEQSVRNNLSLLEQRPVRKS